MMKKVTYLILIALIALAFYAFNLSNNSPDELNIKSNETTDSHVHEEMYMHHVPTEFPAPDPTLSETEGIIHYPEEKHFANMRQLTFGGENAEAYFSFDDQMLVLQRTSPEDGVECDQIYYGYIPKNPSEKFNLELVSTGLGRTTCSYFLPGDQAVLYASTHLADRACPPKPETGRKYLWPLYPSFEIFYADLKGNVTKQLTNNKVYDAEATVSPDGNKMVFTSTRSGDIELYVLDIFSGEIKQITFGLGYDGGAFFSPDSKQILFRASRPTTPEDIKEYKELLAKDLVAPTAMELFVCNIDGSDLRQITDLGKANWAPFFHPSGQKIVFSSNHKSERGFPFNIYMINIDGSGLEQITFDDTFDSFPMFSNNGKKIVFSSNRNNGDTRNTNVFIADWVE